MFFTPAAADLFCPRFDSLDHCCRKKATQIHFHDRAPQQFEARRALASTLARPPQRRAEAHQTMDPTPPDAYAGAQLRDGEVSERTIRLNGRALACTLC